MWQSLARVNHVLTQSLMGINHEPFKITTPRLPPVPASREREREADALSRMPVWTATVR